MRNLFAKRKFFTENKGVFGVSVFGCFTLQQSSGLNAECSALVKRYLLNRLGCATFNGTITGKESRVFSNSKIVLNGVLFFQNRFWLGTDKWI
ncbi:hypothetical protein FQA39_LY08524 [Lamprigera yunnana]|nr:hypothetical protein FQA39_LY08524 [Lamprigera yunnana]